MSRPWRQSTKPRISPDEVRFDKFSGVVNTRSRKDVGMSALVAGDNVVISDTQKVTRRGGYSLYLGGGNVRSAYGGTGRLYVVAGSSLLHVATPVTDERVLTTGLIGTDYRWDSINNDAYYVNGIDAGLVRGDVHLPWRIPVPTLSGLTALSSTTTPTTFNVGQTYVKALFRICATHETADGREGPPCPVIEISAAPGTNLLRIDVTSTTFRTNVYATEADGTVLRLVAVTHGGALTFNPARGGRELTNIDLSGLPEGITHVAFCKGRAYVGQYLPSLGYSVIWKSRPFAYHLFNQVKDYFAVPGQLMLLLSNNKGSVVGTDASVFQYHDVQGELEEMCDYGMVPGNAGDTDAGGTAYFWTVRGMCQAHPFKNLTEQDVSMPPGARAVASIVYLNGLQQFVTVTQGDGEAFNQRQEQI